MARLNEPPVAPGPSTDTVDAIKRRFLRQNRELAKTNSQQSIRIRNLETEGSRLLAENLSLREQVLQLQNALESRANRPSVEDIDVVKSRLEAKLLEFGSLVAELGQMQEFDSGTRRKSQSAATKRSPEERQWRSGLGLQAVENAMLPTIVEDKYFPRRTMGADEILDVLADPDSQSPDIGPPPIARFESEEPIEFNPIPPPDGQVGGPPEDPDPALSVNLETRKKRRESGPKSDLRRVSFFGSPPEDSDERPSKSVRTGAKRKFSVQEDDDKTATTNSSEIFRFSRRNTSNADDNDHLDGDDKPQSPSRPVLGNKPVNTDPVLSPKKKRPSTASKPEKKPTSKTNRGRLTITRTTPSEIPPLHIPEPLPTAEINLDQLPPKTPAVEEIFSPPSTEPSASQPETKDTPPPGDINQSDQTGLGMRPSRRARPQVSYKEPSLNTKMRRPGKELVDAVVTASRRSSAEPMSVVKRELSEPNSAWKSLPSATRKSAEDMEVGSPLREKLGRRDGSQATETAPEPPKLNSSAASSAISALISATSTKRKASSTSPNTPSLQTNEATQSTSKAETEIMEKDILEKATENIVKQEEKDNLAIFDFTDSSPNDPPMPRARVDSTKAGRNVRRHSALPASSSASSSTEDKVPYSRNKADASLQPLHSRSGSTGATRSTSTSNLNRSSSSSKTSTKEKKTIALASAAAQADAQTGNLRAERAASRRKSMLL